jgi:vancomycin resistance protein YoaR
MRDQFCRFSAILLTLFFLVGVSSTDVEAQRRKRRQRRVTRPPAVRPVVTNPTIAAPGEEQATGADGERIISTADAEPTPIPEETSGAKPKSATKSANDPTMQQTINALSNQVDRLNDKLTQLQANDRTLIDMERLTRAEQRSESLRSQQIDVESKLADLGAKLEQIEFQLKPENIERAAGFGTLHPEEARDSRRRQLENERARAQAQVRILETSRTRLETAVQSADAEVDALRRKIEMQQATQDTSGLNNAEPRPVRRPKQE